MVTTKHLFIAIASLGIIINLDGGAVPASVDTITRHFALEPWQVGLLGSLVYLGIATGAALTGLVLQRVTPLGATRVREFLFAGRATRPPFPSRHASFARASVRSAALPRSPRSHLVICSSISSRVFPLVSTTVR